MPKRDKCHWSVGSWGNHTLGQLVYNCCLPILRHVLTPSWGTANNFAVQVRISCDLQPAAIALVHCVHGVDVHRTHLDNQQSQSCQSIMFIYYLLLWWRSSYDFPFLFCFPWQKEVPKRSYLQVPPVIFYQSSTIQHTIGPTMPISDRFYGLFHNRNGWSSISAARSVRKYTALA